MAHSLSQELIDGALKMQSTYGLPASVALAQCILESSKNGVAGKSALAVNAKNCLGIKAGSRPGTAGTYKGYRAYNSFEDCFMDYGRFISTSSTYASARAKLPDVEAYIRALASKYSTSSNYANTVISIRRNDGLAKYDSSAIATDGSNMATITASAEDTVQLFSAYDQNHINKWGLLRYFESVSNPSVGAVKAKQLLNLYNHKSRELKVTGAFGNTNVRGGTLIPVMLNLGDVETSNYMLVDKVTHKFSKDSYTMDLTLSGAWND